MLLVRCFIIQDVVRTRVIGAMFYYTRRFTAEHVISAMDTVKLSCILYLMSTL